MEKQVRAGVSVRKGHGHLGSRLIRKQSAYRDLQQFERQKKKERQKQKQKTKRNKNPMVLLCGPNNKLKSL